MAAAQSAERHPAAGPQAVTREGLVGILRARWQVPAIEADQRGQRVTVGCHQAASGEAWRKAGGVKQAIQVHARFKSA